MENGTTHRPSGTPGGPTRRWLRSIGIVVAVVVGVWVSGEWARQRAQDQLAESLLASAPVHAVGLDAAVSRLDHLPFPVSVHPDVRNLLANPHGVPGEGGALRVNRYLERIAEDAGADVLYLIDATGRTLASSNWRAPDSFVGDDYAQRPYFRSAMAGTVAYFYGVGITSRVAGLYIARPVLAASAQPLGVVVVKLGHEALEAVWSGVRAPVALRDRNGIVVLTNVPDWFMRATRPLGPEARAQIAEYRQFGARTVFEPLTWPAPQGSAHAGADGGGATAQAHSLDTEMGGRAVHLLAVDLDLPRPGWTLTVTADMAPVAQARRLAWAVTALLASVVWLGVLFLRQRARRQSEARQRREEAARQETLRLASLGEMASTLAHELNQPLMALRGFVAAGRGLLQSVSPGIAPERLATLHTLLLGSLDEIDGQARRAADIVVRVRGFVRQPDGSRADWALGGMVDRAVEQVAHDLQRLGVTVRVLPSDTDLFARCDRVLIEQVLVNLLLNAGQAISGAPDLPAERRLIIIRVDSLQGGWISVRVADRGPGVQPPVQDRLFDSFVTTRPEGLGMGLKICRSIIEAHGGHLEHEPNPDGGALFTFRLPAVSRSIA